MTENSPTQNPEKKDESDKEHNAIPNKEERQKEAERREKETFSGRGIEKKG